MDEKTRRPLSGAHLLTVFEAVNETRHEIYVGTTGLLSEQLSRTFWAAPPAALAHWRRDDIVQFRFLSYSVAVQEAPGFIASRAAGPELQGWKIFQAERAL